VALAEIAGLTPLQARRRACTDLWFLCTEILRYTFLSPTLHKPWCKWIEAPYEEQYRIFLAPRDHCKTTVFTIGESIQEILKNADITMMLGHYKKLKAEVMLRGIRGHFQQNPYLRTIAPDLCYDDPENESPVWTRDAIQVKRENSYQVPTVYAVGMEASATMMHFDKIKLDDIVVEENEGSATMLQETLEWVQNMEGLLSSFGSRKVDIAGTRWRHNDTYGLMLDNEELRPQIRLFNQAILQDRHGNPDHTNGEPIWPENKLYGDKEWIRKLEVRSGSFRFWSNYMNSPVPKGSAVFCMEDIDIRYMEADGEGRNARPRLPERYPDGRQINYHYYTAVDPNTTETTANDAAAVMTAAVSDQGHWWLVKLNRGHPNQSILIEWIIDHVRQFSPKILHVEAIAYQNTLAEWLKSGAVEQGIYLPLNLIKKRVTSKYARIVALQRITEGRKLHGPDWKVFAPLWDEMKVYTEASRKDDCLDCLADIVAYGVPPEASEIQMAQRVRNPITMDSILGRMKHGAEMQACERDDAFTRRGIPMRRRLFG